MHIKLWNYKVNCLTSCNWSGKMLTFITGGIKSGKSVFAETIASQNSQEVYYIATAIVTDEEMQKRIVVHQNRRPDSWKTIEENYSLENVFTSLPEKPTIVLVDCLTTFLTNRLWADNPELFNNELCDSNINLISEIERTAKLYSQSLHHFIVVSNEVGLGGISPTKIGRIFCDLQGKSNQIFAEFAQAVYFIVSGLPIKIK